MPMKSNLFLLNREINSFSILYVKFLLIYWLLCKLVIALLKQHFLGRHASSYFFWEWNSQNRSERCIVIAPSFFGFNEIEWVNTFYANGREREDTILKRFFVLSDVFAWHHRLSNTTVRSEVHYGRLQKHRYLKLSMEKTWFICRSFGPVLINYLQFRSKLAQVRLQIPES